MQLQFRRLGSIHVSQKSENPKKNKEENHIRLSPPPPGCSTQNFAQTVAPPPTDFFAWAFLV